MDFMEWNEKIENGIVLLLMMIIDKHTINLNWSFKIELLSTLSWDLCCTRMQENASTKVLFIENLSLSPSLLPLSLSLAKLFQAQTHTLYIQCHSQIEMQTENSVLFPLALLIHRIGIWFWARRVFFFFSKILGVRCQIRFRKSNITANSGWGKIYGGGRVSVYKSESERESGEESGPCDICDTNML